MSASHSRSNAPPQRLCIACKEPIPADATVCFHCQTKQRPEKESGSKRLLAWIGVATAVIGFITALSGVVGPLKGWWSQGRQSRALLIKAQRQEEIGEYSAALDTVDEILKSNPADKQALHARLDVAMAWLDDVSSPTHGAGDVEDEAKVIFARLTPVLESGLGKPGDYRAADVVAHLGWLNFLKWRITREDGVIEPHFREALQMEPENVFANAMLGEWVLLTRGSLQEAKTHFATALKTGKAKLFVRGCQLEGMIYSNDPGAPAELIRVANQMRKDGDAISEDDKVRIHSYFSSSFNTDAQMREIMSAAPPDEIWATYQWVVPPEQASDPRYLEQKLIRANVDELSGNQEEALQIYRTLTPEMNELDPRVSRRIQDAVRRLSH